MLWRAEVRVDYWSDELEAHALSNHVLSSGVVSDGETLVTFTWEVDDRVGIGGALFELTERLPPQLDISLTDFGSVKQFAD